MKLLLQALLLTSVSLSVTTANDDLMETPTGKSSSTLTSFTPVRTSGTPSVAFVFTDSVVRKLEFDDVSAPSTPYRPITGRIPSAPKKDTQTTRSFGVVSPINFDSLNSDDESEA